MKKLLFLFIALFMGCTLLPGCYDSIEIDDQTYVVAIGLDKGKTDPLRITLQYALANNLAAGGGGSSSGQTSSVFSIETATLAGGINEVNSFVAKKINLSHIVLLVISEELAKDGISEFIYGLNRNRQMRPTIIVAACKGTAEDYINSIKPIQESDPSKYYELLASNSQYISLFPKIEFYKFYGDMKSNTTQSLAALVGVNKYNSINELSKESSTYEEKGHLIPLIGDFKAGNIPRIGDVKGEIMGLAVFDGDKFVGDLDGEAAMAYLMIIGMLKQAFFTLPDPKIPDKYIALNIKQSRKPQIKVKLIDEKPQINIKLKLEADFTAIQSDQNYDALEKLPVFEKYAENFLKKDIKYVLSKTAEEYHSDIFGFGKQAKKNFSTMNKWNAFHWLSKYQDSTFFVEVDLKMRRPGLMIRTLPVEGSEESRPLK